MNTTAKKLEPAPTIVAADVLAVLDRRLGELQARDEVIRKLIIQAEKTVGAHDDNLSADLTQVEAVLAGGKFVASREKPLSQLKTLSAERRVIHEALKIGRSRQHRLATERAVEIWQSHWNEIAEIEKRRVTLALELQATNRARERLREKIALAGGAGFLATDGVELLGLGDVDGETNWASERLVADGILTRAEIKRMQNG